MKLLQLTQQAHEIEKMLIESGGEITPELESLLTINKNELAKKIDGYDHIIDRLNYSAEFLKKKENEVKQARQSVENFTDSLKERIKAAMLELNLDKIEGESVYFKLSKSRPSVSVSEHQVPLDYMVTKFVPDKEKIKQDLESGIQVEGCVLKESYTLKKYIKKG